jgi:hypothetical protein
MTLTHFAQYVSDTLAIALIVRLLMLRLHSVYGVFCAFVIVDLLSSLAAPILPRLYHPPDYRIVWMVFRAASWVLYLWMVYALLDAMLKNLPGILKFSRKVLNVVFSVALILALFTARPEYSASTLSGATDPVARAVGITLVMERVISSAALIILLAMLVFILWFPVQMPRNLAVFNIGFVVFFSTFTAVLLAHTYWQGTKLQAAINLEVLLLASCYAYWLLFITRAGELKPVRIGHSWGPAEQRRMIGQLEAMNDALLRAARR